MSADQKGIYLAKKHFKKFPSEMWLYFDSKEQELKEAGASFALEVFFLFDERSKYADRALIVRGCIASFGFDQLTQENRFTGGDHCSFGKLFALSTLQSVKNMFDIMKRQLDAFGETFPLTRLSGVSTHV